MEVVKFLIAQGAPLDALNEDNETAFDVALEHSTTAVLHVLSESIKLSEKPQILHSFTKHFLDDRYKRVLKELLQRE